MRSRNTKKYLWGMEMVGRKRGNHEISKCLNITNYLERVLMLLHMEILASLKACLNADFQNWRKTSADFWKPGRKPWQCQCPSLNWDDQICQTTKSTVMGWTVAPQPGVTPAPCRCICGVKDSRISRKHSPPACLNERSALGLELLEAFAPG